MEIPDYFSQQAAEKPLLHVWSLGVEEQFYILFPLLVVLCVRMHRSALLKITSALVLLSLFANALAIRGAESMPAFYLLPTRAWEIGAGAILALITVTRISNAWLRHGLALLAALLLIFGLCFSQSLLEGLVPESLWVVLGTVLAIYLGSGGGSWLNIVLSNTVLVWIGMISYSLYLWHWPILVFGQYYLVQSTLSPIQSAIAVTLMFALAILSWRYVERPFRDRSMPFRTVLAWVACGCIVVAAPSIAVLAYKGFPSRFNQEVARIDSAVGSEARCSLNDYTVLGASKGCFMSLPSHNPADATVVLLGNSHAQMYAPLVTDIIRQNGQGGILVPLNGCLPLPDLNLSSGCMTMAARNLALVESLPNLRVVIIAMSWEYTLYSQAGQVPKGSESSFLNKSLDRFIQELKQHGKIVVLVGPLSTPDREVASIVARQLAFQHKIAEPLFSPQDAFLMKEGDIIRHFAYRDDIIFIRPDLIQCELNRCDYFRDGQSLFADTDHLAEAALPLFRPVFEPALDRAFVLATRSKP
jgi:hypothetical protein